ncbi:hypothetical protein PPSIR1_11375 [Plesiocystis pacifica SIR-1]|uniref:Translocation and assembly module TamB C-terminal domain-containing protein n=1 Tax=Plesiocystis pacifica SIR-1 TaxID=391625 RepID=A6G178_9BACT|nr:hypothetical protein PPSIR1_11375 [Plesiocystis pacifica SIR-1]
MANWQAEADLLAEGREALEGMCSTTRYRHLFPEGPNLALLFRAYQDLERWRTVTRAVRDTPRARRRSRRRFRKRLKALVREDALARDRRLVWNHPLPRPQRLSVSPPPLVLEALLEIDPDTRAEVAALVHGRPLPAPSTDPSLSSSTSTAVGARSSRIEGIQHRGLEQFRHALINAALGHPRQVSRLHPQYLQFMASPMPTRRRYPIATALFVKLPVQLLMFLVLVFNVVYMSAYYLLNDERLGGLVTDGISGMIDGELAIESLHWSPWLIFDLLTGQPHEVVAHEVSVYEPFKVDGQPRGRRTAYAEHLEAELVLHEVIPWNRLHLLPKLVEIPWVLHFSEVRNRGDLWVDVRAYENEHRDGEWMLSLIDAFDAFEEFHPPPDLKRMSYRIDDADFGGLVLTIDMEKRSGWATQLILDEVEVHMDFENWAPQDGRPEVFPLAYSVEADAGSGTFTIAPLHDGPMDIQSIRHLELASGMNYRPLGDLWVAGDADLAGSPSVFQGRLLDVFGDLGFDFQLGTTDLGPLASELWPAEPDDRGVPRSMISGPGAPARMEVKGPLDEIVLEAVGQGLTLDLFPDPAWALDDVDVSLALASDPLPEMWGELTQHPANVEAAKRRLWQDAMAARLRQQAEAEAKAGGPPPAAKDDEPPAPEFDDERWILYLDTFRGSAFDGSVRLHRRGGEDHVVLPREGEPLLVSIYLDMLGVNLGQLDASNDSLRDMLAGETRGGLQVHEVVIQDGVQRVEAELHRVTIARDRGPEDDNLPRRIEAAGEAIWDAQEGLDLRGLRIGVDGGSLRVSGGVDATFTELDPTSASVRVDDGEAFLAAFGLPRWFDRLGAGFTLAGPLSNPTGSGSLDIAGAGTGALAIDDIQGAKLKFERGALSVRSEDVGMLGGHGPLDLELGLMSRGKALDDPRLRLAVRLEDIDRDDILGSGIGAQGAAIELKIDDGAGKPVRLSKLQARGGAYADTLRLAGVDYRDAEASFAFTREGLQIDHMTLAYHRPISPALMAGVSVPVGRLQASGTVGFQDDPKLDLEVEARNVPLSALAQSASQDLPLRGKIARGSKLEVTGSLRRPQVEGVLKLQGLGAAGVPLGAGELNFTSEDVGAAPAELELGRAATIKHRQIRVRGALEGPRGQTAAEGQLDWKVDATVAFGGGPTNPIEAAVDLRFDTLPLDNLLSHPSREQWRTHLVGGLHELALEARYCPSHDDALSSGKAGKPMLEQCAKIDPDDPRHLAGEPVRIDLSLAKVWYRGRRPKDASVGGADPCLEPDTTCSITPLQARLEGTTLSLTDAWTLRSGGKGGAELTIDGTFDLSSAETDEARLAEAADADGGKRCVPGIPDNASLPPGETSAQVTGDLDLSALGPLLSPYGIASPEGRLEIGLDITGVVSRPTLIGYLRLPEGEPLALSVAGPDPGEGRRARPIPIELGKLDLEMRGGTLYIDDAAIEVFDEVVRIGEIANRSTFLDLAGPCSGRFAVNAAGSLDGALIQRVLPSMVEASGGAAEVQRFHVSGDLARFAGEGGDKEGEPSEPAPPLLDGLSGTISFGRKSVRMGVYGLGDVRVASGLIELRQCTPARPCRGVGGGKRRSRRTRGIALWVGGQRVALSTLQPSDALNLRVADRGQAALWGEVILDDTFAGLERARLTASADMFPLELTDNSGRPELEAALSSRGIAFETDGSTGRISGKILVERSSWLRDARQGVAVLSFADPGAAPPSQLPAFIRNLELDMELETGAPFRVDNNIAKRLEASADLRLGGTVGDPELAGTIEVERGVVDVDILGGAYDVQGGKVELAESLADSELALLATRQDPIKINNQLLTLNLRLSGTLGAIQWECSAPGDTSGALATTRGCVDYLIFDAGNTDLAGSDIRDNRNNDNNLLGTRFLPLAGRLTQVEVNEVLEKEIPRVEAYLPYVRFRVDQLGVLIEAETRPEWLAWGWGRLGLNFSYLRGYPGMVIRDSRSVSGMLEILENTGIEATFGNRNYSRRVFILDPPNYQSLQFIQHFELPSLR